MQGSMKWGALAALEWPGVVEIVLSIVSNAPLKRVGPRDPNLPGVFRTSVYGKYSNQPADAGFTTVEIQDSFS